MNSRYELTKQPRKYSLENLLFAAAIGACVAVAGVDLMIKHQLANAPHAEGWIGAYESTGYYGGK